MNITSTNTKFIKVADLRPNEGQIPDVPANPRYITEDEFRALVDSLREDNLTGVLQVKVYQHDGEWVVLDGNMRLKALQALAIEEVQCVVVPEGTDSRTLRKIVLTSNSNFGQWDWDLLSGWPEAEIDAAGIDIPGIDMEKDINGNEEVSAKEDDFDEMSDDIPKRCEVGDIWLLGDHRLICGDSTEADTLAKLMRGEAADLWLTDPPYNVNVRNSQGMTIENDNISDAAFENLLDKAFAVAQEVMRAGAVFYVWFASKYHIAFERALNRAGLSVRQEIIWNKNHFILGRQDYQWKHEPALYGWKEGAAHYFFDSRAEGSVIPDVVELNIENMKKEELRVLLRKIMNSGVAQTVMDFNKPTQNDLHPTMKPVELWGYLMRNSSKKGDIVLDTFGGSGTTIVTAEQMGRKARCVELDPHYCDVILARWEKLTGRTATKS